MKLSRLEYEKEWPDGTIEHSSAGQWVSADEHWLFSQDSKRKWLIRVNGVNYNWDWPVVEKREAFLAANGLMCSFSSRKEAVSALELALESVTLPC